MNSWEAEFKNSFVGKRIVVTGSSGFIGGHLCDALIALGADVYGLDRGKRESNFKSQIIDLVNLDEVRKIIKKTRPEIVFHLASLVTARQDITLVEPMLQNNLLGTVNLLIATKEAACQRIVIMGSAEEADDGYPNSPYAASKAATTLDRKSVV